MTILLPLRLAVLSFMLLSGCPLPPRFDESGDGDPWEREPSLSPELFRGPWNHPGNLSPGFGVPPLFGAARLTIGATSLAASVTPLTPGGLTPAGCGFESSSLPAWPGLHEVDPAPLRSRPSWRVPFRTGLDPVWFRQTPSVDPFPFFERAQLGHMLSDGPGWRLSHGYSLSALGTSEGGPAAVFGLRRDFY
mgnify:CR=1 FL=1